MRLRGPRSDARRGLGYGVLALTLVVLAMGTARADWHSDAALHTLLEVVAATMALIAGLIALVRFYAHKTGFFLYIGTGLLVTSLLDVFHAVVTSSAIAPALPSAPSALLPWSWTASRVFFGALLLVSWAVYRREGVSADAAAPNERRVFVFVAVLAAASMLFFAFTPLPAAYREAGALHRPAELLAGGFFLVTLGGYLTNGAWRDNGFHHALVLSLILAVAGQVAYAPFSQELFDGMFDAAHLLKAGSYALLLAGLLAETHTLFRQAEAEGASQFRRVLEMAPDGMLVVARDGTIGFVNERAQAMFQWPSDELVGQPIETLLPDNLREGHIAHRAAYTADPSVRIMGGDGDLRGARRDGTEFPVAITLAPLGDAGGHVIAIVRDVSALRALEEGRTRTIAALQQAATDLDHFTHLVARELHEPLGALADVAELLTTRYESEFDTAGQELVRVASTSARHMHSFTAQLVEYANVHGASRPHEVVSMDDIADTVERSLAREVASAGGVLTRESLPRVVGDRAQLAQLLRHLIRNALTFSGREPPHVHLAAERRGDDWLISVRDNGVGVAPEGRDRLFALFARGHHRTDRPGAGVGLAICKRIVERHHGVIWIDDARPSGSVFRFTVPAA